MGVYIKNMKMPKYCLDCPMCDGNDDCVVQEEKSFQTWEEQRAGCPLIEVPTPHGRLIDADSIQWDCDSERNPSIWISKKELDEEYPAIIEAEEE